MDYKVVSLRAFVGAKNFELSRRFYCALGFTEIQIEPKMSYFHQQGFGFYLQDYYVQDWVDNTMLFMEVDNVHKFWTFLQTLDLEGKFEGVELKPVVQDEWGSECFVRDPCGVCWHFGEFKK